MITFITCEIKYIERWHKQRVWLFSVDIWSWGLITSKRVLLGLSLLRGESVISVVFA